MSVFKGNIRETIHSRSLRAKISVFKGNIRETIHIRSIKIRQSSIKNSFTKAIHNKKTQMKLTLVFAFRNATRSKYRSFLLIIGILLTVALETGIVISVDTLYDDFIFDHRNQNYTDITVNPKEWADLTTLKGLANVDVRLVSGVTKASPVYYTTVNRFMGEEIRTNVLLYGIDSSTHPDFRYINVIDGKREVSGQTIMISESIQDAVDVEVGTPINLASVDPRLDIEVTVGGIMSNDPYFGNELLYSFILVDIETLYNVVPEDQRSTLLKRKIDVSVDNFLNIRKIGENIKDKVGLDNYVLVEKDISEIEATGIRSYQTAMNLVILASFVVEFLFITNILTIAMKDRQKEFGILRAVGTNSRQLIELITVEILFYSIIGSILGVFAGIFLSTFLIGLLNSFYTSLGVQAISIHLSSIFAAFMSGITVALIAGLYPIFLAISMPVVQNIHSRMRTAKSSNTFSNWKLTVGAGILLAIIGFSLQLFIGPTRFLDFSILSIHFFVVLLIFLGTILFEIGILVFLPRIAMRVLLFIGIVTRTITTRNIDREFQKSLFTIMTSAFALAFIIIVGLTSAAVITSVPDFFQNQWGRIELVAEVSDTDVLSIDLTQELDRRNDIERSSFIQEMRTDIGGINAYVYGVDALKYSYFAEPVMESINLQQPAHTFLDETTRIITNTTTGAVSTVNVTYGLISHRLYQRFSSYIPLGSNVSVRISSNTTIDITLAAIIRENVFLGDGEYLYISSSQFQSYFNTTNANWFICEVYGSISAAQIRLEVHYPEFRNVLGVSYISDLMKKSLIFQSIIFQVLFVESFILAAMAQFICILVSTLRMEREMGIMRGIGLHKRGVFGIFITESIILGFSALIVGLIDGLLGSVLLAWYISLSIPITIAFHFDRILLWVIISFMITIASTILPSIRSSQKNVVATISGRPMVRSYVEKPMRPFSNSPTILSSRDDLYQNQLQTSKFTIENKDTLEPTTLRQFLKRNKFQIQTVFLILVAITTLNYILDIDVIIRGLMPSDIILRIFSWMMSNNNDDLFLLINPLLFFIGLAAIGPVSYYFIHGIPPDNLIGNIMRSLIFGLIGIICCFIFSIGLNFIFETFIRPIENLYGFGWNFRPYPVFLVFTILSQLIIFQRIWAFLVLQGVDPDIFFENKFTLTRKLAAKGQLGFVLLLLLHIFIQAILFGISQQQPITYSSEASPLSPHVFIIQTSYEVGFFLLFIVYQLVQIINQSHSFTDDTVLKDLPK
ncbi:MAG: ABC transporter permease [Candidatus Hodarchaeales archaeon]|jgi:putative ABC transport system permease protein